MPRPIKPRRSKVCAGCGCDFVVIWRGDVAFGKAKFCTHACSVEYEKRQHLEIRRQNAENKKNAENRQNTENRRPDWRKARCKWCAEGVGFPFSSGMRLHGSPDFVVAGLCTAPTEAEHIVELQEENERLLQANRYACDVTNQALADRDVARAIADEAVNRSIKVWQSSPAYGTFVTLKHGPVDQILRMLQDGQISRSRTAEALAELAHGIPADQMRLPEPAAPTETCQRLKERLAELEAIAEPQ